MHPFLLQPYYKTVLWGGSSLGRFKHVAPRGEHIGESWEVSAIPGCESVADSGPLRGLNLDEICRLHGEELMGRDTVERFGGRFPLLIKFIDAADRLSVQVHPGGDLARRRHGIDGKDEMWYILQSAPEAKVLLGFREGVTPEAYDAAVAQGDPEGLLNCYDSRPGDVFYIPSGQVHGLGAGNFLVEIQQPANVTYRIHDYNRRDTDGNLRQLHTAEAREALCFAATPDAHTHPEGSLLRDEPAFRVERHTLQPDAHLGLLSHTVTAIVVIDGSATLESHGADPLFIGRGHSALIPAGVVARLGGNGQVLVINPNL